MRQTLFYIPNEEIAGLPVFGRGWLLLAWAVFSIVLLIWLIRKQGSRAEAWGYAPLLVLVGAAIWFVLPRLCEPQGLPIRGYGVMLLVAVSSAVALAAWRARRLGVDPELIVTLAFWMFVPGIVGARAFYVIQYWPEFQRATPVETLGALVNVTQGGLVVYGSVIGGILGLMAFVYKYKMPPLATFDLMTPSFLLGLAIGRLGCLLNGCCYGETCDLLWAVTFPGSTWSLAILFRRAATTPTGPGTRIYQRRNSCRPPASPGDGCPAGPKSKGHRSTARRSKPP